MEDADRIPTYNLRAVVRKTGIRPDTLRAWERRYGLPHPHRTRGGHRLYSRRDIDIIRWLMAREAEGMRIGQAVALWRALEAEGRDPLMARPTRPAPDPLAALRSSWIEACLRFDEEEADRILSEAFALHPVEQVCCEVIQAGLEAINDRWYRGEATAQHGHFASALVMRRLNALIAAAPPPIRPQRILIGCPPEESHAPPALLLTLLLRRRGWEVVYLGPDIPLWRLEEALAAIRPHLVVLLAQMLPTAATLADAAEVVARQRIPLAYGGRIFQRPRLGDAISGVFLGTTWEEAIIRAEALVALKCPIPPPAPLPEAFRRALQAYRAIRPQLELEIWQACGTVQALVESLNLGPMAPPRILEAALRLGRPEMVAEEWQWAAGLLCHHGWSAAPLAELARAYARALRRLLSGEPAVLQLADTLEACAASLEGSGCGSDTPSL
ncbi:MAG: MerR family transcriptional regulator [Thermoflexus sp.]|jgi:DNA-binding transcriptional MerR regulator|nr:MerR family transcriptional regulator [Thermoflexus sp.]